MIAALLAGVIPKIIASCVAVVALMAVYFRIRQSGKQDQKNADLKATLKAVEIRNDVEAEVARESNSDVARDLRKQRGG